MTLGRVHLDDGSSPIGFRCEHDATFDGSEITRHGGWRQFRVDSQGSP